MKRENYKQLIIFSIHRIYFDIFLNHKDQQYRGIKTGDHTSVRKKKKQQQLDNQSINQSLFLFPIFTLTMMIHTFFSHFFGSPKGTPASAGRTSPESATTAPASPVSRPASAAASASSLLVLR
jgi:hypothetical protein